jgi:hypothetical protein
LAQPLLFHQDGTKLPRKSDFSFDKSPEIYINSKARFEPKQVFDRRLFPKRFYYIIKPFGNLDEKMK